MKGEPEGAALGVLADGEALPGMDHRSAQCLDPAQRVGKVVGLEVGERASVAGAGAAAMEAERRALGVCLPALAFALAPVLQLDPDHALPEALGPLGVVGGALDQRELRIGH